MLQPAIQADMPQPVIGVSSGFTDYGDYLGVSLARPLAKVGAVPFVLPYLEDAETRAAALDRVDGVLLGFGRDISPARYSAEPHPSLTPTSPIRDEVEIALALEALDRGLPVLGICRGMQILNIALGGTLYRDRSEYPEGAREHPGGDWATWDLVVDATLGRGRMPTHPAHAITIRPDTRLAEALGAERAIVNSYQHQAIRRLGRDVVAVAWADDGIIEAIEVPDAPAFALAVQWELQESWRDDERFLRVFDAFTQSAALRPATA